MRAPSQAGTFKPFPAYRIGDHDGQQAEAYPAFLQAAHAGIGGNLSQSGIQFLNIGRYKR
ncbi:MAG: hypothetical protein QF466_05105 [Desulfobacterales bacterium]|nr:hypothetical protein [Desulfobacterales bacterium]